mmetsp:Transcript_35886/g.55198  ORF Transcript_35886/g.55198 Transcript_35886/m.55198 type:complete len:415 (-) Transcript_35886:113-1357(-)
MLGLFRRQNHQLPQFDGAPSKKYTGKRNPTIPGSSMAAHNQVICVNGARADEGPETPLVSIRKGGKIYHVHALVNPEDPAFAYIANNKKKPISTNMGCVMFCYQIPRVPNTTKLLYEIPRGRRVQNVAIKVCSLDKISEFRTLGNTEDPVKELELMKYVGDNKHVLDQDDILCDDHNLYVVMPDCDHGDLLSLIYNGTMGGLPEHIARYIYREILVNLAYLQRKGIIHRDVSSENIMFDDSGNCLLIDLGMALRAPGMEGQKQAMMGPLKRCGKHPYMTPEIFDSDRPFDGYAIDLWASAVILYSMLIGLTDQAVQDGWRILYHKASSEDVVFDILTHPDKHGLETLLESWELEMDDDAKELLQSIFQLDPANRPSLEDVMNHRWVTNPNVATREEFLYFLHSQDRRKRSYHRC